jgi:hypothetical protein
VLAIGTLGPQGFSGSAERNSTPDDNRLRPAKQDRRGELRLRTVARIKKAPRSLAGLLLRHTDSEMVARPAPSPSDPLLTMAMPQPMVVNHPAVMSQVMLPHLVMMQSLWRGAERVPQLVVVAERPASMISHVSRMGPSMMPE